jgi:hypothetical protein
MHMANGQLPDSDLMAVPGGRLRKDAAKAWIRMRNRIGKETGLWICPTSARTAYRTLSEQVYFWNLYVAGRGNLAARPGSSNHGWGTTVDVPQPAMRSAIDKYGASYGWSKRWSDAPSEWWHIRYDPARDQHKGEALEPKKPDYTFLHDDEQKARRRLMRIRRRARKYGGFANNRVLIPQAREAKAEIRKHRRKILDRARADGPAGWKKYHRRERYRALGKTLRGAKK